MDAQGIAMHAFDWDDHPPSTPSTTTALVGQLMHVTILERELAEATATGSTCTETMVLRCVAHFLRQHIQGHARLQDQVRARELARIVLVHRALLHN
jgi:hypothetical protein